MNSRLAGSSLGLLALLGGQLSLIYLFQSQLSRLLLIKSETLASWVLPGLIWPLSLAFLGSAWLARRGFATAFPIGFSLSAAALVTSGILTPVFHQALGQGTEAEAAGELACSAGVALTALLGLTQMLLAPLARAVTGQLALPVALVLGAAVALTGSQGFLEFLEQYPLPALAAGLPLLAFGVIGLPRPFALPASLLILALGGVASLVSSSSFEVPLAGLSLWPQFRGPSLASGWAHLWVLPEFSNVVVPMIMALLARDLLLLREAQQDEEPPPVGAILFGMGLLNLLGALFGAGLPLGAMAGYPAFRRLGCGQSYAQASGLCLLAVALTGCLGQVWHWAPLPTLATVMLAVQLFAAGLSLNRLQLHSLGSHQAGFLLVACSYPFLLIADSTSAVLLGLCWGGIAVEALAGHFSRAAWVSLLAAALAATGTLHQGRWQLGLGPAAVSYLLLAILFRVGHVMRSRVAPAPSAEAVVDHGGHGTAAIGLDGEDGQDHLHPRE